MLLFRAKNSFCYANTNWQKFLFALQIRFFLKENLQISFFFSNFVSGRLYAWPKYFCDCVSEMAIITSSAFVERFGLSSAGSVQSAVKGLLEKDFLTHEQGKYSVCDLFMGCWPGKEF
jgi:hypothetical protein